jgi:hypothetical protein
MEVVIKKRGRPKGSKNKKKAGDTKPEKAKIALKSQDKPQGKKRGRPSKADLEARKASMPTAPTAEVEQPKPAVKSKSLRQPTPTDENNPFAPLTPTPPVNVFNVGDRVKNLVNGEGGVVLLHRAGSPSVYVHWGGGYSHYVHADTLKLIKAATKEEGW